MSSNELTERVLVIASCNAGKIREFTNLLAHLPLEIRPQPADLNVEETGSSFAENARIKASTVAKATGHWALADDSGLSVNALNGAPGVHSARFADSDAARISRLLFELEEAKTTDRSAQFTAALAVADPNGKIQIEVEGECPGTILAQPRGDSGFGYDPVFYLPELDQTFAEMQKAVKNQVGHRGRAFSNLEPQLRQIINSSLQSIND